MRTRRTRTHLQFSSLAWIEIDTGYRFGPALAAVTGPEGQPAGWPEAAARVLLGGLDVDGLVAQAAGQGGRTKAGNRSSILINRTTGGRLGF